MTEQDGCIIDNETLKVSPQIKFIKLRTLLVTIGNQLSELLESKRIGIYLRGRASGNWALAVSRDISELIENKAKKINQDQTENLQQAIETKQPCLLEEILEPDMAEAIRGENLIVAPMACANEAVALLLADFDAFASLSDRHLIQLSLGAQLIKTAIEREFLALQVSKLEKNLSENAMPTEDQFFHNEQLIQWVINREIERSKRHGSSFAVFVLGFDNLPHIMSEYGAEIVENVIAEHLDAINHIIRKCDLLTRRGGDRFLCVTMEQDAGGVMVLAAKIKHRVKETVVMCNDHEIQMTISIGITLCPDGPDAGVNELIERAESELINAQARGNRVRLWRPDHIVQDKTTEVPDITKKTRSPKKKG